LVKSVYFNLRNNLPKSGTFPPGHPIHTHTHTHTPHHTHTHTHTHTQCVANEQLEFILLIQDMPNFTLTRRSGLLSCLCYQSLNQILKYDLKIGRDCFQSRPVHNIVKITLPMQLYINAACTKNVTLRTLTLNKPVFFFFTLT